MHSCSLENPIFLGAAKFEFEETDDGKFLLHAFLISNKLNDNNWMVTSEANKQDGHDFVGKPDILFINDKGIRDHTTGRTKDESLSVQEPFRKGTILRVKGTDKGVKLTSTSEITDEDTKAKIRSHDIQFVSPAIFPKSLEDVEIVRTGPNTHIHIVHRYDALHRAFVDDPAYGIEAAIGPICEGNGNDCLVKLQQIQAGIGDDEVDPIRTIPLIKIKTSKCSETGNLIFEMPAGELNDLVSECLSEKLVPGEEPSDQDLAICFSEARKKLKESKAKAEESATVSSKSATRSSKLEMGTELETAKKVQELEAKAAEIETALKAMKKANDDSEEDKKKEAAKKAQEEEEKKKQESKKSKKGEDDMTEDEKKEAAKRAQEEEKKKEDEMTAKIASELSVKIPLVEKYVRAKVAQKNLDEKAATALRNEMLKASVETINAKLDDIGPFAAMQQEGSQSQIGYGAGDALTASKYDTKTDAELEEMAGVTV